MAKKLPEVGKTISSFISEESGRISKHNALTLGAILAGAAASSIAVKGAFGADTNSAGNPTYTGTSHVHSHMSSPPPPPPPPAAAHFSY
ncbi:MAG: hypothetical protein NTW59_04960 [Candidatus Diapherotrites archaeon]|nr:hypothetical protein [Candidatus Diapherotrites archaeon]